MSIWREYVVKRVTRSSEWPPARKAHIKKHPICAACPKKKGLEVHHIIPFHIAPSKELDPKNLITFCRKHHFIFGHLENWKTANSLIHETVRFYRGLLLRRLS